MSKNAKPTINPTPEPWLNTSAACKHLAISVPTLRRWLKAGKVAAKRTPTGGLRFRKSDLDELIA